MAPPVNITGLLVVVVVVLLDMLAAKDDLLDGELGTAVVVITQGQAVIVTVCPAVAVTV